MNLIEQLLQIDKEKFTEKPTKKLKSKRLSEIFGKETEITIQALGGRRLNEITAMAYDKKGNREFSKTYDANLMYCVHGVVEPSLKDKDLIEHFNVGDSIGLAELLFGVESGRIASEIVELSGVDPDAEEEVKNS